MPERILTKKEILRRARWADKAIEKAQEHLEKIEFEGGAAGYEIAQTVYEDSFEPVAEGHAETTFERSDSLVSFSFDVTAIPHLLRVKVHGSPRERAVAHDALLPFSPVIVGQDGYDRYTFTAFEDYEAALEALGAEEKRQLSNL